MKWWIAGASFALVLPVCAVEHDQTYQRTFQLGGGERKLIVENINGPIRVVGDSGNDVRVTVREHFTAETDELLSQARSDIKLEMKQEGNAVRLYLDGPFRDCPCGRSGSRSYGFNHEFEVQVPRDIAVSLKTVNAGKGVYVENVRGNFNVRHVNGPIEMKDVAGEGSAETVNGRVVVTFVQNPRQPSTFKTLNGTVDVAFQPDLAADMNLSIMHGDAWTDFEFQPLAVAAEVQSGSKGFRYRLSDRNKKLRIGAGGLEHSLKTMNGSIKIRKYGK